MKRSTLLAALILASLGAYIYWEGRETPADPDVLHVFEVEKETIERIEIRRRGEEPVVVTRNGDSFRLVAPLDAPADAAEVDLLLQNLETIAFDRVVAKASEVDLEEFGLSDPGIEVRFVVGADERSLAFGKDAPTTSNQYARRDDADEILVLESHRSLNFEKTAWDLRDKSIFDTPDSAEIHRITIERPAGTLVLARERGLWQVVEPRRARADRFEVTTLASRLRDVEMRDVVSESGELEDSYRLAAPSRTLQIELEGGTSPSSRLDVGAEAERGFYARSGSRAAIFLVASDVIEELDRPAEAFESKKLFDFSTFEVTRFRIQKRGEAERVVAMEGSEEKAWKEAGRELDRTAVEEFLYALNGATASELQPGSGIDGPDFEITVWSKDSAVEEWTRVKVDTDVVLAHRAGDDVVLKLSPSEWSRIEELASLEPKAEESQGR